MNNKFKYYLWLLFSVTLCDWSTALADDAKIISGTSLDIVKRSLPDVKVRKTAVGVEVEYCPDNKCEIVNARIKDEKIIGDYIFLYFFYVDDWTYDDFKKFKIETKKYSIEALERNLGKCPAGESKETIKCVLGNMEKKHGLKMISRTYDEGEICDTEYSLEDMINQTEPKTPPPGKCVPAKISAKKWGKPVSPIKKNGDKKGK